MILIHSNYMPGKFGGIEKVVLELISISKLVTTNITCFYGANNNSIEIIDNVSYIGRKILFKIQGAPFLSLGNLFFIMSARKAKLIIFQEPFPFLWPSILFLNLFTNKRVIVLIHANPVGPKIIMRIYKFLRSFVFSKSICVSTSPNLLRIVKSSQYCQHHCIPLSISIDPVPIDKFEFSNDNYVLYIGRIVEYKGIKILLKAALSLPDVKFIIAGTGSLSSFVYNFIKVNSLNNIIFINRTITENEKFQLIRSCEFIVFPSISENEAFGLVQLEAMYHCKAIINTWLDSGVNFVAPNGVCAITVDKFDVIQLSEAINFLWINQYISLLLGNNGKRRFLKLFNQDNFIKSWKNLIKNNYVK